MADAPRGPARDVRVALVGFGFAAQAFHLPLLRATPGLRVTVVGSSRPDAVRAALPDAEVVPARDAATHPDADLVVVATPNDTHAPLAEAAMRAGRHVVVDKPFALTLVEARELAQTATACGVLLSVFQNRRWDGDFLTVRAALRDGLVGRVALLESRLDRFRPQVRDRWRESAGPGAGLLYDLGPHLIDQALALFGVPDAVQATLAAQRAGAVTDDLVHVVLRHGTQVTVLQAASLVSGGSARFVVHGDRASLVKRGADVQEAQLRSGMTPGAPGWGVDADDAVVHDGATGATRDVRATPGDQRRYYAAVRDAIHGRGANPVSPAQACAVMAVLEAARRADAEGRRVAPDVTPEERDAWR